MHTILAKVLKLAAGMVMTLPAIEPKLAGFPEVPALVSVHVPLDRLKLLLAASVRVTGLRMLVTGTLTGTTGAAVPAVVVEIFGIVPARLVPVKLNGPPGNSVVIFCTATKGMAGLTILVKVQVICALERMLVAGMVSTLPARVPNVPAGFPDAPALPSEQLADEMVKFVATVSVMVTAVPLVVARIGVVTAGAAVPALEVVMLAGAEARFVAVKVKGPPADPRVIFCTATVAAVAVLTVLVMVHVIFAAAFTLAAGTVSTLPASAPKLAGFPVIAELASTQVADVAVKFAAGVSVIVTAVLKAVTLMAVGAAGVAVLVLVVVIAAGAEARFVAAKVNGPPMAPAVIFCRATVAVFGVLVKVHVIESP